MRTDSGTIIAMVMLISGCVRVEPPVSFQHDIQPILKKNCLQCHVPPKGMGYLETGLSMATYEDLMKGTIYGPVVIRGDSRHSILNMLVEGRADPSIRMPHGKESLGSREIEILQLWVEHGALNN